MTRSVSSTSRYELVPPPAPKTAARPATLGVCQVRLQLSMLLLPMTARANFWARKLSSLVVFEQLKIPKVSGPCFSSERRNPSAATSSASSQPAGRNSPFLRTRGVVNRPFAAFVMRHLPFRTLLAWPCPRAAKRRGEQLASYFLPKKCARGVAEAQAFRNFDVKEPQEGR